MLCQRVVQAGEKLHHPCLMWDTLCVSPVHMLTVRGSQSTGDTPEHAGTSLWHRGLANSNTRSGLEDSITAFSACHQSIQFIPLRDQHLFYSVRWLL